MILAIKISQLNKRWLRLGFMLNPILPRGTIISIWGYQSPAKNLFFLLYREPMPCAGSGIWSLQNGLGTGVLYGALMFQHKN